MDKVLTINQSTNTNRKEKGKKCRYARASVPMSRKATMVERAKNAEQPHLDAIFD